MLPTNQSFEAMTVGDFVKWISPKMYGTLQDLENGVEVVPWPADVFGLIISLLRRSGSYREIVSEWPPNNLLLGDWIQKVKGLSQAWRTSYVQQCNFPAYLRDSLLVVKLLSTKKMSEISSAISPSVRKEIHSLLELASVADETFAGLLDYNEHRGDGFYIDAREFLPFSTLCMVTDPSRFRVLPKTQTSKRGLTSRSLSQHLALCQGVEISTSWFHMSESIENSTLDALIVPWPYEFHSKWVAPHTFPSYEMPAEFGFFQINYTSCCTVEVFISWFAGLLSLAESKLGKPVDVIIFPESSLSASEFKSVIEYLDSCSHRSIVAAGVYSIVDDTLNANQKWFVNEAVLSFISGVARTTIAQKKHNRWLVDRKQLSQYKGLESCQLSLLPNSVKQWWEAIHLFPREITFASFTNGISICVLIAEDLTKIDPLGELIRSVGPTLIIALSQDAAQTKSRWPGRYISILSDDPGSSVLTVTSSGLVDMSVKALQLTGATPSDSIALWTDSLNGADEIQIPSGSGLGTAAIVTFEIQEKEYFSADGRSDIKKLIIKTQKKPEIVHLPIGQ